VSSVRSTSSIIQGSKSSTAVCTFQRGRSAGWKARVVAIAANQLHVYLQQWLRAPLAHVQHLGLSLDTIYNPQLWACLQLQVL
jgi:hypothetical protein